MFTADDLHLYLISNPPAKGSCSFVTTPITAFTLLLPSTLISKVPVGFHNAFWYIFLFSRCTQKATTAFVQLHKHKCSKQTSRLNHKNPACCGCQEALQWCGGGGCVMRPIRVPRQRRPGDQVSSSSSSPGLSALFPAAGVRLWSGRKPCSTKKDSTSTAKKSSPNSSVSRTKLPMRLPFL